MAKLRFDDVKTVIIDPDAVIRDVVRTILHNNGFRQMRLGTGWADLRAAIKEEMPDLLISECQLNDGDFDQLVRDIRHHQVGDNPFVPIIALSGHPTPEMVGRVVGAGVDDLLPKPLSTGHLLKRIQVLVESRKPFIVTTDYVGPDRRKAQDWDNTLTHLEVPNVLKAKITGTADLRQSEQAIADALATVNLHKLERHAVQIGVLAEMIVAAYDAGEVDAQLYGNLDRLNSVAEDTGRRLAGTKYAHVAELCESLITVAGDIRKAKENPAGKDLKLLPPLSQAVLRAFDVEEDVAALARKISSTIAASE
jgi:DNA-binding response OmpR family regulator